MLFSRTQANTTSTVGIVLTSPTRRATEVAAVCTWHWAQRPNVICLGWSLVPAAACRSIQYCRSRPARSQEVLQRSFCLFGWKQTCSQVASVGRPSRSFGARLANGCGSAPCTSSTIDLELLMMLIKAKQRQSEEMKATHSEGKQSN